MKKWLLLLCLIVITGCNTIHVSIDKETIQQITYENVTILKKEYDQITNYIGNLTFKKGNLKEKVLSTLIIVTNQNRYQISITEGYHMTYQENDESYYSKDTSIKDFFHYLEKIKNTYLNESFYTISKLEEYQSGNNDVLIKLDMSDDYLLLVSDLTITDFRIHKLEVTGENTYEDIDLLFQKELIEQNHRILIRMKQPFEDSPIRITFTTPYLYEVSIIPKYENGTLTFLKEFKKKENS